jgi:hypothetical protein
MRHDQPVTTRFDHHAVPVFHDHLEGSNHCVECAGPCTLTDPTQAAMTSLIRSLFDSEAVTSSEIPYQIVAWMGERGIDVARRRLRAAETWAAYKTRAGSR